MDRLLFFRFRVTNSKLKKKSFTLGYKLKIEKKKVPLRVTNLIGKILFFHFRVTNSKLKNRESYFQLLIRKMKEQNLDFEVSRNFFIAMKYTIQNYLKKILPAVGIVYDNKIIQRMHCVMLL